MQQRPVNMTISDLIRYLLFLTTDLILAYILSKKKSYPQINLPSEVANLSEFQFEQTHQKIADELNSTREVISRLLKQLEKQGKIELGRNKISVRP